MTVEELTAAVGYLIARYLHIVCTALIVGGTLFYEMVVPAAVEDMPEGQQLAVMGRSRWVFRWVVWLSSLLLLSSGVATTVRHWSTYTESPAEEPPLTVIDTPLAPAVADEGDGHAASAAAAAAAAPAPAAPVKTTKLKLRSGWWFVAHASTGFIAVLIAVGLTLGGTPPARPVQWMRLNLVILLIVIFLGTVAREVRLAVSERQQAGTAMRAIFPSILPPPEAERD